MEEHVSFTVCFCIQLKENEMSLEVGGGRRQGYFVQVRGPDTHEDIFGYRRNPPELLRRTVAAAGMRLVGWSSVCGGDRASPNKICVTAALVSGRVGRGERKQCRQSSFIRPVKRVCAGSVCGRAGLGRRQASLA